MVQWLAEQTQLGGVFRNVLWLIVLALSVGPSFLTSPATPTGKHCPTATVQVITELVYVVGQNGEIEAHRYTRPVRKGEKDFRQCRCGERQAAERVSQSQPPVAVDAPLAIVPPALVFQQNAEPIGFCPISVKVARLITPSCAPPTPPPNAR